MYKKVIFVIASIGLLCYIAFQNYSITMDDKTLTPNSFYRGNETVINMNPKEYYNNLIGAGSVSNNESCKIDEISGNPVKISGNTFMFTDATETDAVAKGGWDAYIGEDGSGIFVSSGKIYKPIDSISDDLCFKNSNRLKSSLDPNCQTTNIELIVGDRILIVFEDVLNWWCHSHNPTYTGNHDKIVGNYNNSDNTGVPKGYVIGYSKDTTKVKIYKIKDNVYKQGSYDITNVSSYSELDQLNSGKWFLNKEEVVLVKNTP